MAKLNFKVPATPKSPLDIARAYIAAGVPIFPCREIASEEVDPATGEIIERSEKAPYVSNGLKGATRSERIINILFGERHPGATIGIPTGESFGAWVLDLDRHGDKDGHVWLADMEKLHGPLPDTARATTANGGTHIFFNHHPGVRNRAAIVDGVDTRGEGGYIVGPGSVMADGRSYQWVDHDGAGLPEFADAPDWLLDMVVSKAAPVATTEYVYRPAGNEAYVERAIELELSELASTGDGGRNHKLNEVAFALGQFVGAGAITRGEAEAELEAIARQWPNFAKSRGTIKSGLSAGEKQPRVIPERHSDNDNTPSIDTSRLIENTRKKREAAAAGYDGISEPAPVAANMDAAPKKRERFELTWFDEIEEGKPKETILKGWLGEGEFTTISGLPGTGKSVVTTDLACHIAAGMDWHGIKVKQGLVIYVAAERKKLTERRMMAFRKHHSVKDVPLLVVGGMLDFTRDRKDAEELIAVIREAETVTEQKCIWIIIDTLTRVFGNGDQNASKDMGQFVRSCDTILTATGAHVTAIHHSAWSGERGKGAIDLDGAVDASFMVKKEGNKHRLVCDGTNDGEEGDVLAFTMQSVTIGQDEEGEPTTAPVVVVADLMEPGERMAENIKGHNARAFEILTSLIGTNGIPPEGPHFPDSVLVVKEEVWRQAFYTDDTKGTKQDTLRSRFKRAHGALIDTKKVSQIGEWVFIS